MVVRPVAMDIPLDILAGLDSGDLFISGGIRNAAGQFVAHLPKVSMPASMIESTLGRLSQNATRNSLLLGLGAGVLVAAVSIGVALKKDKRETEKQTQDVESQARDAVEKYNSTLSGYLIAIQAGTLSVDILDDLIAALDTIRELAEGGRIAIEFSHEESEPLVRIAYEFTLDFARANSVEFNGIVPPTPDSVESSIGELRQYLELQKEVFRRSA